MLYLCYLLFKPKIVLSWLMFKVLFMISSLESLVIPYYEVSKLFILSRLDGDIIVEPVESRIVIALIFLEKILFGSLTIFYY